MNKQLHLHTSYSCIFTAWKIWWILACLLSLLSKHHVYHFPFWHKTVQAVNIWKVSFKALWKICIIAFSDFVQNKMDLGTLEPMAAKLPAGWSPLTRSSLTTVLSHRLQKKHKYIQKISLAGIKIRAATYSNWNILGIYFVNYVVMIEGVRLRLKWYRFKFKLNPKGQYMTWAIHPPHSEDGKCMVFYRFDSNPIDSS